MGCESQTRQLACSTFRSHSHCKRVFILFYQRCRYHTRGNRGWQRTRSLPKAWQKIPDIHSGTICLRVRTYLSISLSTSSILTHSLPLCQMESDRWYDCINPICKILGCVFCSVLIFYYRFFATSYLRRGDYVIFARSLDLNVCLLSNSNSLCIDADRFDRGIEFHSTTTVATFARGKKDFCKI